LLTKVTIRNFKRFDDVSIELGNPVVFIGPNNSGKTTALQALALWDLGLRRWNEKRAGKTPEKRPGVTINRRDLIALPVPNANLLWRGLHVRDAHRVGDKAETRNVRIDIIVEGVTEGKSWECGLEFDYANEESFYCRPLRKSEDKGPDRWIIPSEAANERIAFLPPMSGLAANETRLDPGAVNVRLGEGRTAEVLRNLCYRIATSTESRGAWQKLVGRISDLFRVKLDEPLYVAERGEITMTYRDPEEIRLDISAAGRGLQQTLLLLAHLTLNPKSVLLIDEPDAHLEILRQRQIYQVLADATREHGSQIILASHSEVILNEAADRDVVVAFLGKPHRIDDRGSQLLKSLNQIEFDHYYQAEQTGWVLYLEGSTDLAILHALAEVLGHPAKQALERPFVHYVQNQPSKAREHFYGLRAARQDLQGFALFDRTRLQLDPSPHLEQYMWRRREIENYLCYSEALLSWAQGQAEIHVGPLFGLSWRNQMEDSIQRIEAAMETLGKGSPWLPDSKVSDDFLDPLFKRFFESLDLPNLMRKTDYHSLAPYVPRELIDPEVSEVLDRLVAVCDQARPVSTEPRLS
jgi:ABC-type branched-subunit amino acid transport system ATPase component